MGSPPTLSVLEWILLPVKTWLPQYRACCGPAVRPLQVLGGGESLQQELARVWTLIPGPGAGRRELRQSSLLASGQWQESCCRLKLRGEVLTEKARLSPCFGVRITASPRVGASRFELGPSSRVSLPLPSPAWTLSGAGGCPSQRCAGGKLERGEGGPWLGLTQLLGEDAGEASRARVTAAERRPDSYWFPSELRAGRQVRRGSVWLSPAL